MESLLDFPTECKNLGLTVYLLLERIVLLVVALSLFQAFEDSSFRSMKLSGTKLKYISEMW